MRAKVLVRSTSSTRGQPSGRSNMTNTKRKRAAAVIQQDNAQPEAKRLEQDSAPIFELPALAQLLQGIDQEKDDDDTLFLPTYSQEPLQPARNSDIHNSVPGSTTGSQDQKTGPTAAIAPLAQPPLMSLLGNAEQLPQQFDSHSSSIHDASSSPAALNLTNDAQHSLQQPILSSTSQTGWDKTANAQLALHHSDTTQHAHDAMGQQDMQPDLLLPEEPLSPHMLDSILNMPALSFDSSQHVHVDDMFPETPQSHQQQQNSGSYHFHSFGQQHPKNVFEAGPDHNLQPRHPFPVMSASMGDLQWADSCPVPVTVPNVIRKTSSDSTIDPSTGKLLAYGKAMVHRNVQVELPAVAALFNDISSTVSQKSWLASDPPPTRFNGSAARAAKRRRSTSSMGLPSPLPGSPNQALPTADQPQQQYNQQVPQLHLHGQLTAPTTSQMHSYDHAAATMWHADLSASAMQQNGAVAISTREPWAEGIQAHPALTQSPQAGNVSPARPHLHPPGGQQHPLRPHAVHAAAPQLPAVAVAGLASSDSNPPSSVHAGPSAATAQAGGGRLVGGGLPGGAAARRGFGGILSGVVKEAAETATKRPPVFRYEDFKSGNDGNSFRGVSRDRWSVQWTASIPKADKDEGEHFLGKFSQQSIAARACDIANLKVHGASAATNFPAREYEEGMDELAPISVLDIVLALQRQGAIGQFRNSRYQGVWQLDKSCWEARLEEARTQESSTSDKPSVDVDQSQSQRVQSGDLESSPA